MRSAEQRVTPSRPGSNVPNLPPTGAMPGKTIGTPIGQNLPRIPGESGPTRRPPQADKGGNPFLQATADDEGPQVKAPESKPSGAAGSSGVGSGVAQVIGEVGNYVNQQMAIRPGQQRPAQPALEGHLPGGGFSPVSNPAAEPFTGDSAGSRAPTTGSAPGPRLPKGSI